MIQEHDGVSELWFESEEDLMETMSSREGQMLGGALLEDKKSFIDHSRSPAFMVKEHDL